MSTRKLTFTIPRLWDGRFYVQVIEQWPSATRAGEWESQMYPLKDEYGAVRTFATPTEAWDMAKVWEREQQQQANG